MKIYNVSEKPKKYIVARYVEGNFWFWGSWDDFEEAMRVSVEIGGQVIPLDKAEM